MTAVRVVGVDISLASTGIARATIPDHGPAATYTTTIGLAGKRRETLAQTAMRLDYLTGAIDEAVGSPDLAVVEGRYNIAEANAGPVWALWWAVVIRLWARGVPVAQMAPTTLKLYFTGSGRADKSLMLDTARRVGVSGGDPVFGIPDGPGRFDVADAIALACAGAHRLGRPLIDRPDDTLAVVKWPTREGIPA